MKNGLLEEIRHDLVSLSGLKAFDALSETITSSDSHVTVLISELIPLDFKEIIGKIDIELEIDDSINADVMDNLVEWSRLITELCAKEIELSDAKETYQALSYNLLEEARTVKEETEHDIIKVKYGGNNDKTRKKYVEETLVNEHEAIVELERRMDYIKRRVPFLKSLIRTKTALLEIKG